MFNWCNSVFWLWLTRERLQSDVISDRRRHVNALSPPSHLSLLSFSLCSLFRVRRPSARCQASRGRCHVWGALHRMSTSSTQTRSWQRDKLSSTVSSCTHARTHTHSWVGIVEESYWYLQKLGPSEQCAPVCLTVFLLIVLILMKQDCSWSSVLSLWVWLLGWGECNSVSMSSHTKWPLSLVGDELNVVEVELYRG